MNKILTILCVLIVFVGKASADNANPKSLDTPSFSIGTHYYGLSEYSWPINYLNAIKSESIEEELGRIKGIGFDTIILLASWSEFEPTIGRPDEAAYKKINLIIRIAKSLGLKVMIRIPYLWSLEGHEIRERIAYSLIDSGRHREHLFKFLKEFDRKVVQKNDNIVMRFGSWEDFYVLRDFFFSGEPVISEMVRRAFSRDTGIPADNVQRNGVQYDKFNIWVDTRIRQLIKEIKGYGYEIRTDSDPFVKDGRQQWHGHNDFYKNESGGSVVAYWAPYFGQLNNGEFIDSKKAIKSFEWMLDLIAASTSQVPFIDQLNFFDNSPGTELNARILDNEYKPFFERLSSVVVERTSGYALWTIRDYSHNIVFNPAFSEGLKGWSSKNSTLTNSGLLIAEGGHLTQLISMERVRVLKHKEPILVVNLLSGDAKVEIEKVGVFDLRGSGRHEIRIASMPQGDFKITLRPNIPRDKLPHIQWISLYGHTQNGRVLNSSGSSGDYFELVRNFNRLVAGEAGRQCRGYNNKYFSEPYLVQGVFSDGWTGTQINFCRVNRKLNSGVRIVYGNPSLKKRFVKFKAKGMGEMGPLLLQGEGVLHICPMSASSLGRFSLSIEPPFMPSIEDKSSLDIRSLGVFIKSVEEFDCQKKEGAW
jgi:hypothetical protein